MDAEIGRVLVVGAGVAGIRAAFDLAETGYEVLLAESSPAIGGILAKLDVQFPTNHCGMCRMLPFVGREDASQFCMRKSLFHDNITILANSSVVACEGEAGRFEVTLRHRARWVDTEVCIGDGACEEVCPVEVPDAFNEGLTARRAIYRPVPQNLPNLYAIDRDTCTRCGECVKVCPTHAIDLAAEDCEETVTVGAVVISAGTAIFDPATGPNFHGYGHCPHVLTSLGFERAVGREGAYSGGLRRPYDGKEARRIAWLLCVGSRDRRNGRDLCSSVCCMFALKEAEVALQKGGPGTEATLFYMDLRTFGREYYRYREAAEEELGVRLVRCRAHSVHATGNGDPVIRYYGADGRPREETFDLVVLATGQGPTREAASLAEIFGYERSETGFPRTDPEIGVRTSRPGILVCGSFGGPKDINESVVEGSAAAAEAGKILRAKGLAAREPSPPVEERAVDRELPAVGVVLCRWPVSEGSLPFDFEELSERVRRLPRVTDVVVVEEVCRGGLDTVRRAIEHSPANRLLFAACLPFIYRQRLRQLARTAGYNSALVDVVDLRGEARRALRSPNGRKPAESGLALIDSAVEGLCTGDPVHTRRIRVEPRALVVGGGISGMQAALSLARHGLEVVLVEKSDTLGGHVRRLRYILEGIDPGSLVTRLSDEIRSTEGVRVILEAEVLSMDGNAGRFHSRIRLRNGEEPIDVLHGAAIVATGAEEAPAREYGYGKSDSVLTQGDLEEGLAGGTIGSDRLGRVVMIQCVGSREHGGREYCSRVCCSAALKNALKILEQNPGARVLVLYRDLMAYGAKERYYTEARAKGVIFATYRTDRKPEVEAEDGRLLVRYHDEILDREIEISPDLLVLSTGMVPRADAKLAGTLGIHLTEDGFVEEADYKFRPVETLKEGVYVCGTAHSPRSIPESLAMAEAAAQRALTILSKRELATARLISTVHEPLCAVCELCVRLCPYEARSVDRAEDRIVVDELACQGCGICVASCPSGAAAFAGSAEKQVLAEIEAQLGGVMGV